MARGQAWGLGKTFWALQNRAVGIQGRGPFFLLYPEAAKARGRLAAQGNSFHCRNRACISKCFGPVFLGLLDRGG